MSQGSSALSIRSAATGQTSSSRPSSSARSVLSVLSLTGNAPSLHVKQSCDLEALKLRYIDSMAVASRQAKGGDQRLDHTDVDLAIAALGGFHASLQAAGAVFSLAALAALLAVGLVSHVLIGHGAEVSWALGTCLVRAVCGWLLAVLVLDFLLLSAVALVRWRLARQRLAVRLDERWRRIEQQREQKVEAMRTAAARGDQVRSPSGGGGGASIATPDASTLPEICAEDGGSTVPDV